MTQLPPDELAALPVFEGPDARKFDIAKGTRVLELGNKKNSTGLYRDWYREKGLDYLCVDWNGEDGAYPFDMRYSCSTDIMVYNDREPFEVVTNFGFTEHVGETYDEQIACWKNVHELVAVGGWLSMCMPLMPAWAGHGRWMPTYEWYETFAVRNGYDVDFLQVWSRVRPTCVVRLQKTRDKPFSPPIALDEHDQCRILRSDL